MISDCEPLNSSLFLASLTRRNFNQCRANKFVAEAVAGDYLLHHRVRLIVVSSFCYDSLVNVGIELFTNSSNGLNTQRIEHAIQLFIDQIYATQKMTELVRLRRLDRRLRFEGALEIVEHRQELRGHVSNHAIVSFTAFAVDTLAIVFKIRLASLDLILELCVFSLDAFQLGSRRD